MTSNTLRKNRWQNFLLNSQESAAQKVELKSLPISIMLPTGKKCNLKCVMCIDRKENKEYKDFSYNTFLKFDPGLSFATSIAIYGWGEPFINPDYEKIIQYIAKRYPGVLLHISTNGTLLNDRWRHKLVKLTNCFLNVSINAANKKTYEQISGFDLFDNIIHNLRELRKLKVKLNSRFPVITLSFVMLYDNIEQLPEYIKLAQDMDVDDVLISDLISLQPSHSELSIENITDRVLRSYERAKSFVSEHSKTTLTQFTDVPYLPPQHLNKCTDPWESLKIGESGDVAICCYANHTFGNIFDNTIHEIWNSEEVKHYRETVNTANPPDPCRKCPKKSALFSKR